MSSGRWLQIEEKFHAALELEGDEREAYLDAACAGDVELRREVERLLSLNEQTADFLEEPAMEVAARAIAEGGADQDSRPPRPLSKWILLCLLLAGMKALAGVMGFFLAPPAPLLPIPQWVHLIHTAVFGFSAAALIFCNKSDRRALLLGAVFLLIASSFSDSLVYRIGPSRNPFMHLHPDAFTPFFLWLFFANFPRISLNERANRIAGHMILISSAVGITLLVANSLLMLTWIIQIPSPIVQFLGFLSRRAEHYFFWVLTFTLALSVIPFAIWRTRHSHLKEERRRVSLFVMGILIGIGPLMIVVIGEAIFPAFDSWTDSPNARLAAALVIYPLLLSVPATTAYSVMVNHVLDVRLILRRALQYALARYVLMAAVLTPAVILVVFIYRHREETVVELFSNLGPFWLLGLTLMGLVMLGSRKVIFDALDRRFFREHYDSRQILASLVEQCKAAAGAKELITILSAEIDRALHLDSIAVLIMNPANRMLASVDGRVRPLSITSELAVRVAKEGALADVVLENTDSSFLGLPVEDRQWVADGAFCLLVPMSGSDGGLLGVIALGEKKSELPFSHEDRLLLSTIADSAAITLELLIRREIKPIFPAASAPEHEYAVECHSCGAVYPSGHDRCSCTAPLMESVVPYILLGKFRFVKQVGRGGMGVVYRALDLMLDRFVAVKALPRASPEYSIWLRREARAMAAVGHLNLALIFGAETWRGVPMLIFEFLEGGTLADRLRSAPLSVEETVDLGILLADVMQHIHGKGVLHRDIKPSNIGYRGDGQPKLMDFGLAHILKETPREEWIHQDLPTLPEIITESVTKDVDVGISRLKDGRVLGTPLYLSPEAVDGAPADISFDLWATAIVLYEALAGENPFRRGTLQDSLEAIALTDIPDIREHCPDCPGDVAAFFTSALAKDRRRRPPTAKDLMSLLEGVGPRQVVI